MSGGISVNSEKPENGWRQRGFHAGEHDRVPRPPADPRLAAIYHAGYRTGAARRRRLHP